MEPKVGWIAEWVYSKDHLANISYWGEPYKGGLILMGQKFFIKEIRIGVYYNEFYGDGCGAWDIKSFPKIWKFYPPETKFYADDPEYMEAFE